MKPWRWLLLLVLVLPCVPANAVIKRVYPLSQIIADADTVIVAKVAGRKRRSYSAVLRPTATLKGPTVSAPYRLRLAGGDDWRELPLLQSRLVGGRTALLFGKNRRFLLGYLDGAWFRLGAANARVTNAIFRNATGRPLETRSRPSASCTAPRPFRPNARHEAK